MNILDKIVAQKQIELEQLAPRPISTENLAWAIQAFGQRRNFMHALRFPSLGPVALIAEIKKASPSAGVICPDFDPIKLARIFEESGAACLSVLTDEHFFQGSLKYLQAIRDEVQLPLLRKDFIIHERQILESIEWGADAILLIVSILTDDQLHRFISLARSAGLAALVEVHDENELQRALSCNASLIGINNRNLKTFKVDLGTSEKLAPLAKGSNGLRPLLVAESGVHTNEDVKRLEKAGVNALLIGEALCRSGQPAEKIKDLFLL